jgi:hypothetical protein
MRHPDAVLPVSLTLSGVLITYMADVAVKSTREELVRRRLASREFPPTPSDPSCVFAASLIKYVIRHE